MAENLEQVGHPLAATFGEEFKTHTLIRNGDLDTASSLMRKVFAIDHRTWLTQGDRPDFDLRAARVGTTRLARFSYGVPVSVRATCPVGQINIGMVCKGTMTTALGAVPLVSCAAGDGFVYGPGREMMRMRLSHDFDFVALFVTPSAVREHLSQLVSREISGDVVFDPAPKPAVMMSTVFSVLVRAVENTARCEFVSPLLANHLDQLVLSTLLLEFPHSYSDELAWQGTPGNPRVVHVVKQALSEQPEHPWTIGELAAVAGVSARTVQVAFQRHVGMSAFELLRQMRLERARDDLRRARAEDSVGAIAYRWGFSHAGRFAATYRRRYRESPSDTLRRSR